MFPGFAITSDRPQPAFPLRSRLLSLATVFLVFAVVATAIAGFAHVTMQQQSLIGLREQSQELRAVHQALTQADADVLHFAMGDSGALPDYYSKIDVLKGGRGAILDRVGTLPDASGADVPAAEVIDALEADWSQALQLAAANQAEAARTLLSSHHTGEAVSAIGNAVEARIAAADDEFQQHEQDIRIGTLLVLLLQVGGGTLAILGLVSAFRSGTAEASGRILAVKAADQSREQVARLFEMADVLQSASDHADANAVLKATATELVPGFSGALYVFNNSRDRLVLSAGWGRPDDERLPDTINPGGCWALKRGKPHLNRVDGSKLCCEHHQSDDTVLEIPMIARGEIMGLFQLFAAGADAERRLEAITGLGSALADGMSLALANMGLREKLRNQALRDPLTGLYNRRYMEDCLQRFVRLADRENREVSVVMVDLDHFKALNDKHGHAFGDNVLRDAAMTIVGALRETDIVCRYGGEELVVILPDCNLDRAADKAELLRVRTAALSETHAAEISASFGVASVPYTSSSVMDLLAAADSALYRAKQAGRNRVVTAPTRPFQLDRLEDGLPAPALQAAE
jgi:diguanylate cyclase (GGDEF)-like protein